MARVVLPSSLARYTGGVTELEVEATDIRGVIRALEALYAGIGRELEEGMAVAIDAEIHQDDLFAPVAPDSEVCFLPRIGGGGYSAAEAAAAAAAARPLRPSQARPASTSARKGSTA